MWCTCDECGDNIRDGVCLNCNFHTCDQYSFNNSSNIPDFYTPPPPSFYCYNCGNPSEEGRPCGHVFVTDVDTTIIVETRPTRDYSVGIVFVINVDTRIVYVMPRVLTRLTLTIRALIVILKMIFMSQIRITMVIHFKIHRVLKIVGDRLKILIMNLILVTILMVFTNPHKLPISIMIFLNLNQCLIS